MRQLTEGKYKCVDCGDEKHLVLIRGCGSRCEDCQKSHDAKREAINELNRLANKILMEK